MTSWPRRQRAAFTAAAQVTIRPRKYAQSRIVSAAPIAPYAADFAAVDGAIHSVVTRCSAWAPTPKMTAPGQTSRHVTSGGDGNSLAEQTSHTAASATVYIAVPSSQPTNETVRRAYVSRSTR